MSGRRWNYYNNNLASKIFGFNTDADYRHLGDRAEYMRVIKDNPLEDIEISEIVFDVLCLLDSYDYYASGDTSEEQYRKDVQKFKDRWFRRNARQRMKELIDTAVEQAKNELYQAVGIDEEGAT